MRLAAITAGIVLAVLALCAKPVQSSPPPRFGVIYTRTPKYVPLAWLRGGERFPLGARLFVEKDGERHELIEGFAASADGNVSFDGIRVLFAGKQQLNDHWQIWELAGKSLRKITSCDDDCVRPFYLPEDRFVYARRLHGRFVIEAAPLRGGAALALTYGPANYFPTDVLRDGRILFESGYPFGSDTAPEIYTVYSDGSGVESYRCDHGPGRYAGRQVASSDIVFARSHGLGRFTSALAHEVEISISNAEYAGDVVEVSPEEWILSVRGKPTLSQQTRKSGAPEGTGGAPRGVGRTRNHFELLRWTPGANRTSPFLSDGAADLVQPGLFAPRPVPNRHPSALHDWNYANLLALNAYTSKYQFPAGSIAAVRLYTLDPSGGTRLLGSAPVEKDGSFYLRTPADQPLKIQLLDANGKTLKKEAGWFWLRKGEQRICVGCHAGPETAPENAVPMVLQRSIVPADLTGSTVQTAHGGH